MTVEQHVQSGGQLANPEDFGATGLEDFGVTDSVIPRLQIVHKEGVFKDNLSNLTYHPLRLIILGLVKQRILWHPEVDDKDPQPMCKSNDFQTGYPNLELTGKRAFPWDKSGYDPNSVPVVGEQKPLPCANCQLKEWGSHPNGSNPYCSEQWTLPVYFDASGDAKEDAWSPALLTLQKSSIKPLRAYLTPFSRTNKPAFTSVCEVTLKVNTRGQVDYSIPTFTPIGESDRSRWMEFSDQFQQMKGYLQQPPRSFDEDGGEPQMSSNQNTAPQQQAQTYSDPNDPWATSQPAQQAPPAQQQAPAQEPVQQVQQPSAPPQTAPPVQQPVQEAPPQQVSTPAPAPAPAPAGSNDLPF